MVRKLLSASMVLLLAVAGFAAFTNPRTGSLLQSAQKAVENLPARTLNPSDERVYLGTQRPDPGQSNQLLQQLIAETPAVEFAVADAEAASLLRNPAAAFVGKVSGTATPAQVAPLRAKGSKGAPKLVTGTLISKDVAMKDGAVSAYRHQLTPADSVYTFTNFWGMGVAVNIKINTATGEVSIPQHVVYNHSTYGAISMVPLNITPTGLQLVQGDLKGILNADGSIDLGAWGIMITDQTKGYYGNLFAVFSSSKLCPPNTEVSGYNVSSKATYMMECLIEQSQDNEAVFYGFNNQNGSSDIMTARLTASKTMVMSPQVVFNNVMYGDFCNYPAEFTYDSTKDAWSVKVNSKGNMVFTDKGNGELKLPGYVIAQKLSPSQTISAGYNDITVITDADITYPTLPQFSLKGEGTEANPFLIENADQVKQLAALCEAGQPSQNMHFALAADINLGAISPTSYVPIGTAENPFMGTLDGRGHTISGVNINGKGFANTGIFGVIGETGKVSNLNVSRSSVTASGMYMGTIAGTCAGTLDHVTVTGGSVDCNGEVSGGLVGLLQCGTITNCSFSGSVYTSGTGGGLAGYVVGNADKYANVLDSHARAMVVVDGYDSAYSNYEAGGLAGIIMRANVERSYNTGILEDQIGRHYLGGISGYSSNSNIRQCFNAAAIQAKRTYFGSSTSGDDGDTETGGLVGYTSGGEIVDCYNAGTIMKSDKSNNVGGLVGYLGVGYSTTSGQPTIMINQTYIRNCYNSGQLITSSTQATRGIVGAAFVSTSYIGDGPFDVCLSNVYYDKQVNGFSNADWGLNTAQLAGALPQGFDSSVWQVSAGKYPTLKNVAAADVAELTALPVVLRDGDNCNKVKVSFNVTPGASTAWALNYSADAGESSTETAALRMDGNTVYVKDRYANAIINASTPDSWTIKLYRLAVVPKMFDGEGSEAEPYLVKTVDDFKKIHAAVAVYGQGHEGDFFAMTNDIDFSADSIADTKFRGVGYGTANYFRASFDGRGHAVKGLKFDAVSYDDKGAALNTSTQTTGLFSVIGATGCVANLTMDERCDMQHYSYGGSVAGVNFGLIKNCRNYSTVKGVNSYIGGISGAVFGSGRIESCYNAGNVYFGVSTAGGITGYTNGIVNATYTEGSSVVLCQNDGNVVRRSLNSTTHKTTANTAGGIVGYNYGSIDQCVNNGTVAAFDKVGGIVGYNSDFQKRGDVTNCVNNGVVAPMASTLNRGGIIGSLSGLPKIENNFYDASVNVNGGLANTDTEGTKAMSTSQLLSAAAPAGLNAEGYDFSADAYPVLKAFAAEPVAAKIRKMYVAFAPKQLRTNVKVDAPIAVAEGLSYTLRDGNKFKIEGNVLKGVEPQDMTLAADSLTISFGPVTKGFHINAVPVLLAGEGTKASPYLIKSKTDWNNLAKFVESSAWEYPNNHFRLENDIDFEGDSISLLAVNGVNFQGVLDGNGHTMSNYVYYNPNTIKTKLQGPNRYVGDYIGLVGTLGNTGEIRNLTVNGSIKGYRYMAAVTAKNYGVIENVTNKGTVDNAGGNYSAGIVMYNYGTVRNCVNNGAIKPSYASASYMGGICAVNYEDGVLDNCVNNGSITTPKGSIAGIVYETRGVIRNCVNNGRLYGATGIMAGVAYTLGVDAAMEGCSNTADMDLTDVKKGSVYGVFGSATVRTATSNPERGYIRNCFNTGNLAGSSDIFGFGKEAKGGWTVSDCYNTGNVTSCYWNAGVTTSGNAQGFLNSIGGAATTDLYTIVERCYNTGDVKANYAGVAGLVGDAGNISRIVDCYNLGNVSTTANGLTAAGLVAKLNGEVLRSFNAGDVYSMGNSVGGLFGYMATGKIVAASDIFCPAKAENCFNLGNVTSDYTGTNTNGDAGGLLGYFSTADENYPHALINCYNAGNVTANSRVGGIAAGAFRPWSVAKNCYNSGKVTCLKAASDGSYYRSGTTFTNSYKYSDDQFMLAGHTNCYYDYQLNPGDEFRSVPGSRLTTAQLAAADLGNAYTTELGGMPVLKDFVQTDAAKTSTAMLLFDENSSYENVNRSFQLVGAEGIEWTAEDIDAPAQAPGRLNAAASMRLAIEGNTAMPRGVGRVLLTAKVGNLSKSYELNITQATSAADGIADKDVKEVIVYDLNGRRVDTLTAGNTYIVRTVYTDGTARASKKVAR